MATLTSPLRFILPFSTQQTAPFGSEVEAAAVFAFSEFERNAGRGLIVRQADEELLSLTKMGYPLWLFPQTYLAFIFDALSDLPFSVSYAEVPSAELFMENLQASAMTRDCYMAFLLKHASYFLQPPKIKQLIIKGLIADADFKNEFSVYCKEATEATNTASLALLPPVLEASTITSMVDELSNVQQSLIQDAERLVECRRQENQTTSQYIAELEFAAQSAAEEVDAKIRALEELVKPQVAKLNSEYKRRTKGLVKSFDVQIVKLRKLKIKTQKYIKSDEQKIKLCEHQIKVQASKHHEIYEKRWKEKRNRTEKEVDGLKHELNDIEKNIENLNKQMNAETSKLDFELTNGLKLARKPLLDLAAERDAKMLNFKQETDRLIGLEKPVVDGMNTSAQMREPINAKFETLGIKDQQLKTPALFYVPFYVACYASGTSKRYLTIPPSIIAGSIFSAKLRGVFNISKIGDLLNPRFKAITPLIRKLPWLAKQNIALDKQFGDLTQQFNLIKNNGFFESAAKGLVYLNRDGWVLDKEYEVLSNRLTFYKSG